MRSKAKKKDSADVKKKRRRLLLLLLLVLLLLLAIIGLVLWAVKQYGSGSTYTVTWVDGDNTVLQTDKVKEGETPKYTGSLPEKASDYYYVYDFDSAMGWTNVATDEMGLKPVIADVTYQAIFTKSPQDVRYIYDPPTESYTVYRVIADIHPDHSVILRSRYNDEFDPDFGIRQGILPVTTIDKFAFRMNYWGHVIESFTIPDSIVTIREGAFVECKTLEKVNISMYTSRLKTIEKQAFYGTDALKNFTFPVGLETIGEYAFMLSGITSVNLAENAKLATTDLSFVEAYSLTDAILPDTFQVLDSDMFLFCSALESIEFSTSITDIGTGFFYDTAITELYIPAGVTTVGSYIVSYCDNLTQIRCGAPDPGARGRPPGWDPSWNWHCNAQVLWGQSQ